MGKRLHARAWGSLVGAGACQKPVCQLLNVVSHLFLFTWLSACIPTPLPGRGRPKGQNTGLPASRPCPCGATDRRASLAAPVSTWGLWGCSWPQGELPFPSLSCAATQSWWYFPPGSCSCRRGSKPPSSPATWAQANTLGLPDAKDLGGASQGHCALYLPSPGGHVPWAL